MFLLPVHATLEGLAHAVQDVASVDDHDSVTGFSTPPSPAALPLKMVAGPSPPFTNRFTVGAGKLLPEFVHDPVATGVAVPRTFMVTLSEAFRPPPLQVNVKVRLEVMLFTICVPDTAFAPAHGNVATLDEAVHTVAPRVCHESVTELPGTIMMALL